MGKSAVDELDRIEGRLNDAYSIMYWNSKNFKFFSELPTASYKRNQAAHF